MTPPSVQEILRKEKPPTNNTPGHTKTEYYYTDLSGKPITDTAVLRYVENIKPPIPPAYRDVKIFYARDPSTLQKLFEGFDAAGRKQQIYSPTWNASAYRSKFEDLVKFGEKLPSLQRKILKFSRMEGTSRDKVISVMLRLINECHFRIGHPKYERKYGSIGVSTLRVSHLKELKNYIRISFRGKKGVQNECNVRGTEIIRILTSLTDGKKPGDYVFLEDGGKLVTPEKVNRWLEEQIPGSSTKMFRTFDTNILLIEFLRKKMATPSTSKAGYTQKDRTRHIKEAMDLISDQINNTPAILKKNYASRELYELYIQQPAEFERVFGTDESPHEIFIKFLKGTLA